LGSILINPNPSAYSCLVNLSKGKVGLLYEAGKKSAYETIRFEIIPVKYILNSKNTKTNYAHY